MRYFNNCLEFVAKTYWLLLSVMLSIPLLGFVAELVFLNGSDVFARSGSILIAFTLVMTMYNHSNRMVIDDTEQELNLMPASRSMQYINNAPSDRDRTRRKMHVERYLKSIDKNRHLVHKELRPFKRRHKNIVKAEYFGGIFGTLTWGFGDLIVAHIIPAAIVFMEIVTFHIRQIEW